MKTTTLLLSALCLALSACGGGTREPRAATSGSCAGGREWDLGNGSIEDIRALSPDFYSLRPAGYRPPATFGAVDGDQAEQVRLNERNRDRIASIQAGLRASNPDHVKAVSTAVDGLNLLEFAKEQVSDAFRVLAWASDDTREVHILIPASCGGFVAKESCSADGRSMISVRSVTKACDGGNAVTLSTTAGILKNMKAKPGVVTTFPMILWRPVNSTSSSSVHVLAFREPSPQPIWQGSVVLSSPTGATADDLDALLEAGETSFAKTVYAALAPGHQDLDDRVSKRRLDVAKKLVASEGWGKSPFTEVRKLGGAPPTGLPGDDEVGKVVAPALVAEERRQIHGDASAGQARMRLLDLAMRWDPSPSSTASLPAKIEEVEKEIGPRIQSGAVADDALVAWFTKRFPKSVYTTGYFEKVSADKRAAAAAARVEGAWSALESQVEEIAFMIAKKKIVATFPMTPRRQRDITMMGTVIQGRITNDYCAAKQAYVDLVGPHVVGTKLASKCTSEPPTTLGPSNAPMKLTSECQTIIATACAQTAANDSLFMQHRAELLKRVENKPAGTTCEEKCMEECAKTAPTALMPCHGQCTATKCGGP
jgi:hypothetical protein